MLQTKLYIEDWIGLRKLDEGGRVHFVSVPGRHLGISRKDMKKYVVPFLKEQTLTLSTKDGNINVNARISRIHRITHRVGPQLKLKEEPLLHGASLYRWTESVMTFIADLLGRVGQKSVIVKSNI